MVRVPPRTAERRKETDRKGVRERRERIELAHDLEHGNGLIRPESVGKDMCVVPPGSYRVRVQLDGPLRRFLRGRPIPAHAKIYIGRGRMHVGEIGTEGQAFLGRKRAFSQCS